MAANTQSDRSLRRRHRRDPLEARLRLVWYGETGEIHYVWATCIDISRHGMQVELDNHSVTDPNVRKVSFRFSDPEGFAGSALVRHVRERSPKYVLGLEFLGGLEWNPELILYSDLVRLVQQLSQLGNERAVN